MRAYSIALGLIIPCTLTTCLTVCAVVVGLAVAGVTP